MPTTRVLTPPTAASEPVKLGLLVAHVRADIDAGLVATYLATPNAMPSGTDPALWAELELLQLYLSGAREKVQAYTGRYYGAQQLAITYELGEGYELPAGGTAVSVSGFFATLAALAAFDFEEYRKGISVNRQLPWSVAMQQRFTVVVNTTGDTYQLQASKNAILQLAASAYKDREPIVAIPVSVRLLLAEARVTVLGE